MKTEIQTLCGAVVSVLMLCGCAYSYVDVQGNRHTIGLVDITLPPADTSDKAADWVRRRTLGISMNLGQIASSFELGYSDSTTAVIANNSCAYINPEPWLGSTSKGDSYANAAKIR